MSGVSSSKVPSLRRQSATMKAVPNAARYGAIPNIRPTPVMPATAAMDLLREFMSQLDERSFIVRFVLGFKKVCNFLIKYLSW